MSGSITFEIATRAVATALLHSVWQGATAAAVAAVAVRLLGPARAQARYVVACAALLAVLGAWTATATRSALHQLASSAPATAAPQAIQPVLGPGPLDFGSAIRVLEGADPTPAGTQPSWAARLERWVTAAVPLWFAGVVLLSLRAAVGWVALERMRRIHLTPVAHDLAARVAALASRLRVSRPVRVAHSAAVRVPSVVGWLRPIVLLPASVLTGLSPAQLDAVLAHELAHVRRHDFAVNALQTAAEVLLFYHPACWWLSRRIRVEREHCCDDIAVAVCGDRLTYASALADLETLRQRPALALAATDGPLLQRVRRLVAPADDEGSPAWGALALPLVVVAIVTGGMVVTKAQRAPEQLRVPGLGRTIPGDRGVIEGRVVETGTGRPISGARVEVRGPSDQQYVTTDQSGRYRTRPLIPGPYAVSVTAAGHATAFYDGRAGVMSERSVIADSASFSGPPSAPPRITLTGNVEILASTQVDVGSGSLVSGIDLAMHPNAQLSGRILDDRGRGLSGAYIQLVATGAAGAGPLPRVTFARSDAEGVYHVTAAPGDYVVRAYVSSTVRPSRNPALAYTATFYPGVSSREAAQMIRLDSGAGQYDVDFALLSDRTVRVSGTLIDPAGHGFEGVSVALRGVPPAPSGEISVPLTLNARGEFDARDVVPGTYAVSVTDPFRPARWKAALAPVEIADDVTAWEIRAVAPASIAGRVVKDPRSTGRVNLAQTVISFTNRVESAGMGMSAFNLDQDGSFHGDVPTGPSSLLVMGPAGWNMRSIRLDGVEVFGSPIDLAPGSHEIEVVITDRFASVNGMVVDRRGAPLGGFDVVLFPRDDTRWLFASPLIRQTRSRQNGRFELTLLPPGDYLAVATEGVPFLMLGDPAAPLRRLYPIATRLTVADTEQKTISIRASPAPEGLQRFPP
jgi:beta-lactamase regulating signal transducer with metallopeptidase domain